MILVVLPFGWDWTIEDLEKTGERVFTLEGLINVWDGISGKDDILPQKIRISRVFALTNKWNMLTI